MGFGVLSLGTELPQSTFAILSISSGEST
jgi:hypothetical protein